MTRWTDANNAVAAAKTVVAMVTLCDLNFGSGTVRVHDGIGALTFNSQTYNGLGTYGTIDAVNEDVATTAKALQLTLSGVEPSLVNSAMTEDYQGKTVTLYVGLLDINTLAWIANPEIVWEGRMDYMAIDLGQGVGTIKMFCESRLQREPKVSRYTDQDQQIAHPGDNFFNLLWQIPLTTASWGQTTVTHPKNVPPPHPSPHTGVGPPKLPPWLIGGGG